MDINDIRGILTAITMFAFIGLWVFAWNKRRQPDYDRSAALPLEEDRYLTDNKREDE